MWGACNGCCTSCPQVVDLQFKARLPVEQGAMLVGVMDEYGILEEGEVFVQVGAVTCSLAEHKWPSDRPVNALPCRMPVPKGMACWQHVSYMARHVRQCCIEQPHMARPMLTKHCCRRLLLSNRCAPLSCNRPGKARPRSWMASCCLPSTLWHTLGMCGWRQRSTQQGLQGCGWQRTT